MNGAYGPRAIVAGWNLLLHSLIGLGLGSVSLVTSGLWLTGPHREEQPADRKLDLLAIFGILWALVILIASIDMLTTGQIW